MDFQQRFKILLDERNISNYKMAKYLEASKSTIANWLNGTSVPDSIKLIKIADYLDVSVDYLLGRTENPNINK